MTLSNVTRRGLIGGLAAGVTAAAVISSKLIRSARAQSAQKTFVLVPGAFYGAWCWRRVSDRLEKQGHKVYSLTLTGLADRSHLLSKDINLDTHIQTSPISSNGKTSQTFALSLIRTGAIPASGALERIGNRVSSIVWVDALKPADGQSFRDEVPFQAEDGAISRPAPKAVPPTAFNDPKDAAWVLSKVTPQPIGTWLQPVKLSGAREKVAKGSRRERVGDGRLIAPSSIGKGTKSRNDWPSAGFIASTQTIDDTRFPMRSSAPDAGHPAYEWATRQMSVRSSHSTRFAMSVMCVSRFMSLLRRCRAFC